MVLVCVKKKKNVYVCKRIAPLIYDGVLCDGLMQVPEQLEK